MTLQNSTTDLPDCYLLHAVCQCCHYRCLPATCRSRSARHRWSVLTQSGRDIAGRCRRFTVLRPRRAGLPRRGRPHRHPGSVDQRCRLRRGARLRTRRFRRISGSGGDRTDCGRVPDRGRWTRRAHRGTVRDRSSSAVGDGAICIALPVTATCLVQHFTYYYRPDI